MRSIATAGTRSQMAPCCTKLVSEKVERLDRIISLTVSIPAVDELRLLRMQNQPTGPETALQGAPQCPSLLGTSTMADEVVRISFEWDAGKVPYHPHVEGVVQEQIREARAYHPTLRSSRRTRYDAAILHLYRSLQPALDVEARPRAIRMFTDRSQEQFPIDAVEEHHHTLPISATFHVR